MPKWEGSVTLHNHIVHPRKFEKYLPPSQLALVAILRYRNSISSEDIKKYKEEADTERRLDNTYSVPIKIPNMSDDLSTYLQYTKNASSFVAIALTEILNTLDSLQESERDAFLRQMVYEHRAYRTKCIQKPKFPHFSAGNS